MWPRSWVTVDSIEQASETLRPLAGPLAGLLFSIALVFAGVGSSVTSSMAEVNVITGFLGKPEDPKTLVAMATHGHTLIGDILFGSVSESLKHKISIPLLLLKSGT